jgi:hypothetical protein
MGNGAHLLVRCQDGEWMTTTIMPHQLRILYVNLYVITCMQKFEDPIQVTIGLNLIIEKGFEF